jgi:brefeldin A-inhibited guanine nucleotide-exchange protein
LNEIYLAVLARRTAPISQKLQVVHILCRFSADPRGLVEMYLNYDCDGSVNNIFQTMIEDLSKFSTAPINISPQLEQLYEERSAKCPSMEWEVKTIMPPPLAVASIAPSFDADPEIPREYVMKRISLDALVESLRSLVSWSASVRPE